MKYAVKELKDSVLIYVSEDLDKAFAMFKQVCQNVPDADICLVRMVENKN